MTLVLFCSPVSNGKLRKIVDLFCSKRDDVKLVDMFSLVVKPCIDCSRCNQDGKCFMRDAEDLFSLIEKCDRLIFASPVHNYTFPAPMLSFLSRLQPYYLHPKMQTTKRGFLLITAGRAGRYSIDTMTAQTKIAFDELGIDFVGKFAFTRTNERSEPTPDEIDELGSLSENFFNLED